MQAAVIPPPLQTASYDLRRSDTPQSKYLQLHSVLIPPCRSTSLKLSLFSAISAPFGAVFFDVSVSWMLCTTLTISFFRERINVPKSPCKQPSYHPPCRRQATIYADPINRSRSNCSYTQLRYQLYRSTFLNFCLFQCYQCAFWCGVLWLFCNTVTGLETEKTLEAESVSNLVFHLVIREAVQALKNEQL